MSCRNRVLLRGLAMSTSWVAGFPLAKRFGAFRARLRGALGASKRGAAPHHHPLAFESLESRWVLATDPLGITAGYAFNEMSGLTTADVSGHGLTGTLTNGATFTTSGKNAN